jgi:hypothetical protein
LTHDSTLSEKGGYPAVLARVRGKLSSHPRTASTSGTLKTP